MQQPDILGTWSAEADILLELDGEIVKVPRVLSVVIGTDDPGIMFGELLGPNELEITDMETWPHAVIYMVVMTWEAE